MIVHLTPQLLVQALILGFLAGGVYALMSAGLTLLFGIMQVINIAQGALLVAAAYITYVLWTWVQLDPLLSVVITVPVMFGLGLLIHRGILSRVTEEFSAFSVLVTFALAIALEGFLGYVFGGNFRSVRPVYIGRSIELGAYYVPIVRLLACGFAVITLVVLYLIMTRTKLGRAIRATIQDRRAAQLVGVDVERVTAVTFAIGIATTGVGGALLSILTSIYPATHYLWISRLLSIIVLGGMGSLPGAVVGALILGNAESVAAVTISLSWSPIVFYLFLFVILIVRPQGLFGTVTRRGI